MKFIFIRISYEINLKQFQMLINYQFFRNFNRTYCVLIFFMVLEERN